jgi:hypothetical protein
MLAYLNDEHGRSRIQEVLELSQQEIYRAMMCLINLGEVLYMTE